MHWEASSGSNPTPNPSMHWEASSGSNPTPNPSMHWEASSGSNPTPTPSMHWEASSGSNPTPNPSMHWEASSGSAAELASATSGLMPLHSMSSRWLCADTQRLATAQAVSRCTWLGVGVGVGVREGQAWVG